MAGESPETVQEWKTSRFILQLASDGRTDLDTDMADQTPKVEQFNPQGECM